VVVVFGSINVDLTARVRALPQRGETIAGEALTTSAGGKGANQALAARRAGADVTLVGAVGRDVFAAAALAGLRAGGVDLARVREVDAPTGTALIHVDAAGDNTITVIAGANAHADASQADDALLSGASIVAMQLEVPCAASLAVAQRARQRGTRTMLNAAPASRLGAAWLAALDLLVVNATEAAALAPTFRAPPGEEAFATHVASRHGIEVVVTLGARGAFAAGRGAIYRVPAWPVAVVDSVGAGDAFTGCLAAALDRGAPLRSALAFASVGGALACTGHGAQGALPERAAIELHAGSLESRIVTGKAAP
jgi:ribokinase